jgi:PAS domain S-box-containing protein
MDTQLNFLESEKRERNETNMAKIVAISHNPEEQVPITEALTGSLQNATVIPVRSGIAGMKKIRAEQPDIILMDWNGGETTCSGILKNIGSDPQIKHIPLIVFAKDKVDLGTRGKVLKMGASAFLGGPITEEELVAQVNAILNLRREKELLRQEKDRLEAQVSESEETLKERTYDLDKRVRELNCLYRISELREKKGMSLDNLLQGVAELIPSSWQYPENICARILLGYQVFTTDNFQETPWKLARDIMANGEWAGTLEVFYLKRPERDEDLFPKEEASLISIIAERLGRIAERVQAEDSLQFESENITRILKSMEDRVYIVNQQFDMEYINPALKKEFGRTGGKKCYTYFRNRKDPCRGCTIEDVYAGKTVRRERYYPSIRRTYDVVETPLRNKDGSLSKLAIYRDVTALKQAQKALEEREALYRGVTESIADGAVMVQDGKVLFVNHALVEMFGYGSPRELTGIEVLHLFDRDFRGLFRRVFDPKEQGEELENLLRGIGVTKSGKKFWVLGISPSKHYRVEIQSGNPGDHAGYHRRYASGRICKRGHRTSSKREHKTEILHQRTLPVL